MRTQYGKLDVQGGVEHHVGGFLIREYPLVFGCAHVLPLCYRLPRCKGTLVIVADDTSQQAVISRRNPVVVV